MTLAPIDPSNEVSVTDYLTRARDWLSRAVDETGPEQIAAAKAEIATAAEATKQLGLSKEIQEDASEMVRRAEWALRRAQKKAQESGEMRTAQSNLIPGGPRNGGSNTTSDAPRPRDMFTGEVEYRDALAMGELDEADFEEVLNEAKAEGNLSRANVARKAREKARPKPRQPRDDAETYLNSIESLTRKAAREAATLTPAQIARVKPKADLWTVGLRESIETLQRLVDSLSKEDQ